MTEKLDLWIAKLVEVENTARDLADEAARAVAEPRLFCENEDGRQQALGEAVAAMLLELDRKVV